MTRRGPADAAILLIDGRDLLGITTDLTEDREAVLEETTPLGVANETHGYVGVAMLRVTQSGFFDSVVNAHHLALLGSDNAVLIVGLHGNTAGRAFTGIDGVINTKYVRTGERRAFTKANAEYVGDGPVEDGIIVHAHGAETGASGGTDPQDNSSSSADGGKGYVGVSALTLGGYDDVTIKLRDSDDDISYADLISFTAVAAAPAAERKTVAGTVERYVIATYAFGGAGAGQSVTFFAGFVRD